MSYLAVMLTVAALVSAGCGDDDPAGPPQVTASSRAYKGHTGDVDMDAFIAVNPDAAGTRLDDCQSCHRGGQVTSRGKTRFKNPCEYCHFIPFPDPDVEGAPTRYEQTLNPYGLAYLEAGRGEAAVRALMDQDSDGDGFSNQHEIDDLRYPGSPESRPGQPRARLVVLDMEQLRSMPAHTQFMLVNSHKQQFDTYAQYTGVRVVDLLTELGVNLEEITGITVISADGFQKDFEVEAIRRQYPAGLFYPQLGPDIKGSDCGFVHYPQIMPSGLGSGDEIPGDQWLMIGYGRDGGEIVPSYLDPVTGQIEGEGPLRLILPQETPGMPDRGSKYSPSNCNDGLDYDETKDHNAGSMVRGVVAIRINPMPEGFEEFDAMNGGWAYVDARQLIVYGHGIH